MTSIIFGNFLKKKESLMAEIKIGSPVDTPFDEIADAFLEAFAD